MCRYQGKGELLGWWGGLIRGRVVQKRNSLDLRFAEVGISGIIIYVIII